MRRGRLQPDHMSFQWFLKTSVVHNFMSCRRYDGKAFHTRGPASEKLLSRKLVCVQTNFRTKWPTYLACRGGMLTRRRSPIPVRTDRWCGGRRSDSRPLSRKSDALTIGLPSHHHKTTKRFTYLLTCRRWCWRSWCARRACRRTAVSAARRRERWRWCTPCRPCTEEHRWTRSSDSARRRRQLSRHMRGKTAPTAASVRSRHLNLLSFALMLCVIIPAKAREYVFTSVGLSVCLSVTTITKKIVDEFVPHFVGRFLWGKGRGSSCFVTTGRGVSKLRSENSVNRRLFTFYASQAWWWLVVPTISERDVPKCQNGPM